MCKKLNRILKDLTEADDVKETGFFFFFRKSKHYSMQENVADIINLIFSKVLIMVPHEKLFIET